MFFKRKDDLIEESFGIIQRQTFKKREREQKKESEQKRIEQQNQEGDVPKMWAGKKFLLQSWGKVLSYEMTLRQTLNMLRSMVRRGWTNDTRPVYREPVNSTPRIVEETYYNRVLDKKILDKIAASK